MARKTDKTLAQRAEEAEQALARVRARQAREAAKDHSTIQGLSETLETINAEIAANSRSLNGDNSFEVRRQTELNKLAWIEAEQKVTERSDEVLRQQKAFIQDEIDRISKGIVEDNGEEIPTIDDVLNSLPSDEDLGSLRSDARLAERIWRENTPAALKKAKQEAKNAGQSMEAEGN